MVMKRETLRIHLDDIHGSFSSCVDDFIDSFSFDTMTIVRALVTQCSYWENSTRNTSKTSTWHLTMVPSRNDWTFSSLVGMSCGMVDEIDVIVSIAIFVSNDDGIECDIADVRESREMWWKGGIFQRLHYNSLVVLWSYNDENNKNRSNRWFSHLVNTCHIDFHCCFKSTDTFYKRRHGIGCFR